MSQRPSKSNQDQQRQTLEQGWRDDDDSAMDEVEREEEGRSASPDDVASRFTGLFRQTIGQARPPRSGPRTTRLVDQVRSAGVAVPFGHDDEISDVAKDVMEGLLFQLDQRTKESSHLRRRLNESDAASRVRKRDGSDDEDKPNKRRASSKGEDSSSTTSSAARPTTDEHMESRPGPPSALSQQLPPVGGDGQPSRGQPPRQQAYRRQPPRAAEPRRPTTRRRPANPPAAVINGREYDEYTEVRPPGELRSQAVTRTGMTPEGDDDDRSHGSNEPDDASDEESEHGHVEDAWLDELLAEPLSIWASRAPPTTTAGVGRDERDNSMRHMLSLGAYHSPASNRVYVGRSAEEAYMWERMKKTEYSPFDGKLGNEVYTQAPRGLPMTEYEVEALIGVMEQRRRSDWERVEAFLLLRELRRIAERVQPRYWDGAMERLMSSRFSETYGSRLPRGELQAALTFRQTFEHRAPNTVSPTAAMLMAIDEHARFLLMNGRPGSANWTAGVAFDYAFRVGRRSVFGYALSRLLSPADRQLAKVFRRFFALAMALPRRYREAVVEHNRAQPDQRYEPQQGPSFRLRRTRIDPNRVSNYGIQDIMDVLIDNRVPIEWVDHAYPYGVIYLNAHYGGSGLAASSLDAIDDERLARLERYGSPAAIPEWDGWFEPTLAEVRTVLGTVENEQRLDPTLAGLQSVNWLLVGEDGRVARLNRRPTSSAAYTPALPQYPELDANVAASTGAGSTPAGGQTANAVNETPAEHATMTTTTAGHEGMPGEPDAANAAEGRL